MQAAEAVRRAVADGKELVSVEFNLPLIGATDLDDWPGGVRQQCQAIAPMVGELLKSIGTNEKADVTQRVVEDADAVVVLTTEGAQAMVFPTAETLPELKSLAGKSKKSGALGRRELSDQDEQRSGSNLISDLGIGPWKKKNEEFLAQLRWCIGCPNSASRARPCAPPEVVPAAVAALRAHEMTADSKDRHVQTFDERPSYQELEKLLMSRRDRWRRQHHRPSEAGGAVQRDVGFVQA